MTCPVSGNSWSNFPLNAPPMNLYLHAGLYKTASSYLQTVCALNAGPLQERGIHFPPSDFDADMRAGRISPGNAGALAECLKQGDEAKLAALLRTWNKEAESLGCSSILVSAEASIHGLATPTGMQTLRAAASTAGIERIHILAFFRDLVDHALSTYKHRAKSGLLPDFDDWIANVYETPRVIAGVLDSAEQDDIAWTFRAFKKDASHMMQAFFEDWLNMPSPAQPDIQRVNESVTLSEVLVMNEVARAYPLVTDYFVNAFKKLPAKDKAPDRELAARFYQRACHILMSHDRLIKRLNARLPANEHIVVGQPGPDEMNQDGTACLSTRQLAVLIQETSRFQRLSGRLIVARRKLRHRIPPNLASAIAQRLKLQQTV